MKNNKSLLLLAVMVTSILSASDVRDLNNSIIPEPQFVSVTCGFGSVITPNTLIIAKDCEEVNSASFLNSYLERYYGFTLKITSEEPKTKGKNRPGVIELTIKPLKDVVDAGNFGFEKSDLEKLGAYHLVSSPGKIVLTGANPQGLFYAVQTLIQLLPADKQSIKNQRLDVALAQVVDFPRFEYRGMHLDVVRHIYSVDYIKQYIDYIAMHKMNYFHWHLTDDQGWRMESKSHPRLNELGAYRAGTIIGIFPGTGVDSTRYGGYYTIEQMKEVIEYAAQRYITIVPEIDVPGHSMAILAAYPQFSTTPHIPKEPAITWGIYNRENNVLAPSDEVFEFLSDVFNELMDVFPGEYIHVGADECAKRWWQESEETQEYMRKHGIKDENDLQRYFAHRIAEVIHARGRKLVGWCEMVDAGLVEGAVVMNWRSVRTGYKAAAMGHKVIMTPGRYSYLNYAQKENEDSLCHRHRVVTLDSVYLFEPVPDTLSPQAASNIIGGQGCMWTEYFPHRQRLEYGLFPRFSAIAEVYWTLPSRKNWPKFQLKLLDQYDRYDLWGANYSTEFFKRSRLQRNKNRTGE